MSPLTKVFVVLLVVLALLLTAATVTFVSTQETFNTALTTARGDADAQRAQVQQLQAQLSAAQAQVSEARLTANQQIAAAQNAARERQQLIVQLEEQLRKTERDKVQLTADLSRLTEALAASETTKSQLQEIVTNLRDVADRRQTENAQLSTAINDLTNRLEQTERDRRFFAEQLAELRQQNERISAAARRAGIDLRQVVAQTVGGDVRINGVIRNTRTIAGMEYATISVGSADGVQRGMEFNIIDRESGNFLGILTVDTVEANEATGRIRGERVAEIRPGAEVRTQL